MQRYLLIAVGGALGSMARYWVGASVASRLGTRFPYGTLVINITACLIIGLSLEFLDRHLELNPGWRFLVPTGFIGAYSTFSTFEWEAFTRTFDGNYWIAMLYVSLSLLLGFAAVAAGATIARNIP